MSLLAYNLTTSPLALAAGAPVVTLPASASAGARGPAFNVTGELKTLTAPDFALLQAQVAAGSVQYEWSGLPEFNTFTLIVGSAQTDLSDLPVQFWVNPSAAPVVTNLGSFGGGSDSNPGTLAAPFLSFDKAWSACPADLKGLNNRIFLASGNLPLQASDYGAPGVLGTATPLCVIGSLTTQVAAQTAAIGSTAAAYICSVDPVVADGVLRGSYIRNITNTRRSLVTGNVTVLGVCTISVIGTGLPVVAGTDTFTVEVPSSNLVASAAGAPQFFAPYCMGWRDVQFDGTTVSVGNNTVNLFGRHESEAIRMSSAATGRGMDANNGTYFGTDSNRALWLADGVNNPFMIAGPFPFMNTAGLAFLSTAAGSGARLRFFGNSEFNGALLCNNTNVAVGGSTVATFSAVDTSLSSIFANLVGQFGIFSGRMLGKNPNAAFGAALEAARSSRIEVAPTGLPGYALVIQDLAAGDAILIRINSSASVGAVSGSGTSVGYGIRVGTNSEVRRNEGGTTTVFGASGDTIIGVVPRTYAQLPYTENEIISFSTGAVASIGATNNVTGLTGMTVADIGNVLTITGSATAANNDTWLISKFVSATEVVVAGVLVADASGTVGWTLKLNRDTGNRIAS